MQTLISDLLEYSRVERQGRPFSEISCETLLEEALANLSATVRETGAVVEHDPLPVVHGDPTQLMQLFQNLVGNGIKYQRKDVVPRIHVSAAREPQHWHFQIRDNGLGIEREHFDRIFGIFQRLHTRDEYSGTGIGLALCKRIVDRHQGRIWVESEPGVGTTMHFTIASQTGETTDAA